MDEQSITVTVTRSAGDDQAVLVFIDTNFEPSASDGGPGLRVLINDHDTYVGVAFDHNEENEREAKSVEHTIKLSDIAYLPEVASWTREELIDHLIDHEKHHVLTYGPDKDPTDLDLPALIEWHNADHADSDGVGPRDGHTHP